MHGDEFVNDCLERDKGKIYAQWFFLLHRLPAVMQSSFSEWIGQYKLYCIYEGVKYRVTGASRMGDVWLAKDFSREMGYDLRVDLDDCSEWSSHTK